MSKILNNVFKAPLQGISLVEASAGTGKTYTITSLYVRAVLERNLMPSKILVMTYTEAATAELKYRIRKRLNESLEALKTDDSKNDVFLEELINRSFHGAKKILQTAIDSFDEAAVFTIHGFCSRILSEYSLHFDVSPDFDLLTDDSEMLQDCVDEYWREFIKHAEQDNKIYVLLDYLTDTGFGPDELKSVLSEILKHPEAILEPQSLDYEQLLVKIEELNSIFAEVKRLWKKEGEKLEKIYKGDALKRNIYHRSTEERHWNEFQLWLNHASAKIKYPENLDKFGLKISRSGKKSAPDIPELDLCATIDQYIMKAEHLKLLKSAFIIESAGTIQKEYNVQKERSNVLTYNDLLQSAEKGLERNSQNNIAGILNKKYPVALVDEFQDTDPVQYSILRKIYMDKTDTALFMIGDPKQAIYGFRGADIYTYLEAREDSHKDQRYSLDSNYRSNEQMIAAVNTLFSQTNSPFVIDGLDFQKASFPNHINEKPKLTDKNNNAVNSLQCLHIESRDKGHKNEFRGRLYAAVADEILELLCGNYKLNDEPVKQTDIAILIRKGSEGVRIQEELKNRGLKSVMQSRNSVFKTKEANELFLTLKSIYNISYEPGIRATLATEMLGYSAHELQQLSENESEWSYIIEQFLVIKDQWEKFGIQSAIDELFSRFDIMLKLADLTDAERRITNLLHLADLLSKAQREQKLAGIGLLKWFHHKINDESADSEAEVLRLESDESLIQISTMHGAKGLEYNIVFCPFLWEEGAKIKKGDILKFHHKGKTHLDVSLGIDHPERGDFETKASIQQLAESVRLAYVALTRSVAASYLFIPDYKNISQSPLGLLFSSSSSNADYPIITASLKQLEGIELRSPVSPEQLPVDSYTEKETRLNEAAKSNRTDLFHIPQIISYSMLSQGNEHGNQIHDYDFDFTNVRTEEESEIEELNQFTFPKGANAGTCLHKIFEDISFNNSDQIVSVVTQNLDHFGFDEEWVVPVSQWISSCLNQNLGQPSTKLSDLPEQNVLKEMEFFFPVEKVQTKEIWELIRNRKVDELTEQQYFGFMKGYIDLTFKYNDRFYILDYKSNFLGNEQTDYQSDRLQEAIIEAGYDLQYHIYTLALHRYLKHRMAKYSYDSHFGGVLYYFIRGINQNKPGSGIFYHRSESSMVQQLDDYFKKWGRR